jgi:hypothetical protein
LALEAVILTAILSKLAMPFPDPFTRMAAEELVREVADACRVEFTDHVLRQAAKRDVDPADITRALCRCEVRSDPMWNEEERNWVVEAFATVAGDDLKIAVAIEEDRYRDYFRLIPITVIVLNG